MYKAIKILGDINNRGSFEINSNETFKEILNKYAGGIINSKKVKFVQVGGPLGKCIRGKDLNKNLSEYESSMNDDMIMYLSEKLCSVDYLRFLTRFVIRELKVDNKHTRKLNELIESIAQGKANKEAYTILLDEVSKQGGTNCEELLNNIFTYIMDEFKDEFMEHIENKKCSNGICRGLFKAQCINACPAEVYIPGYIELMKNNRLEDAYKLMRKNNPLSFICGKVCARPCEDRCRRGEIEGIVGVRALKRYATDMALKLDTFKEDKLKLNGKKIAIVGSGPAGLTASYYLAKTGYEVTIYEASYVVGGMLALGIPEYRLPQESIDREVKLIKDLGVKIITNTKVGEDISLEQLRKDNNAVLLATGCHIGNIDSNVGYKGVESAINLLKEVKVEGRKTIGENVLVIGGGDVAMDAARTSIRLGAKTVRVASLESFETMPASNDEKIEAKEEGAILLNGYGIKEIHGENSSVSKVILKKCMSVLDDEYNFSPSFDDNITEEIMVDSLIYAIGQIPDYSYLSEDIKLNKRNWIDINTNTYETTVKGVFAVGDMQKTDTAISAIANGKKVAISIDNYLDGSGIYDGEDIDIPESQLKCTTWDDERVKEQTQSQEDRILGFKECSKTFTDKEASLEASRCMRCDRNSIKPLYLK